MLKIDVRIIFDIMTKNLINKIFSIIFLNERKSILGGIRWNIRAFFVEFPQLGGII